jgi:PPM family protein phosphatase
MTSFRAPDSHVTGNDPRLIDAGWATATGPRPDNQDRAATSTRWAVVSDGAGGHRGGALAAQLTVDAVVARLSLPGEPLDEASVRAAATEANAAVRARRSADLEVATMVATLTLAVARSVEPIGSTWSLVDVGDSPAWLFAAGRLRRVSEEDNLAAELVRSGAISRAEARRHPGRHLITRAMGSDDTVDASPTTVSLRPGDGLVLASDGIEVVGEATMADIMTRSPTAGVAAHRLVDAALARDATDNVTVAVVRHVPDALDGLVVDDPVTGIDLR